MPTEYEKIEQPTMKQLTRLQKIGIGGAVQNDLLKKRRDTEKDYYFKNDTMMLDGEYALIHHMVVHVRKIQSEKEGELPVSRLDHYDTLRINAKLAAQAVHRFAWNAEGILSARRQVRVLEDDAYVRPLDDYLGKAIVIDDAQMSLLQSEVDFGVVSRADCEMLIDETARYFKLVDSLSARSV